MTHGPRQDSGSAAAKKVLDGLENDTKANFLENIPEKQRFQIAITISIHRWAYKMIALLI